MGAKAKKLDYPIPPTDPTVVDEYFGIKVVDPYRPLENDTAAATTAWVEAENAVTQAYLSQIPFRESIRRRLTTLNNYPKHGIPSKKKDGYYYFYNNDGLQNQAVLYRSKTLGGTPEVFIDPNTLSTDGTVALKDVFFSHDGKYAAYTISRNGSDWEEIYVIDTKSRQLLDDHLEWTKFGGATWHGDGFYYSAYERPEGGKEFSNSNENHRVYFHRLGTPQTDDILIFEDSEHPFHFHEAAISDDETVLMIIISGEGPGNALLIKDLTKQDSQWVCVADNHENQIIPIEVIGRKIYFFTNKDAPRGRIVTADIDAPQPENWTELVAENDGVLAFAQMAGDNLILTYSKDASHHPYLYNLDGQMIREIKLPTYGTVSFSSDRDHNEVYYKFVSFTYPGITYSYDMATGQSTEIDSTAPVGFNPGDYITEQIFYPSSDGTMVPMFIIYRKDLKKDGSNPVYLYGYGGFNVPLDPGFSANRLVWLENGGIYASANLRGGSEYGEEWHQAGTKMQKRNVFNDFIAAAEYMIDEGWTNPELLTIEGGSNGGLLVGAVTNMRPDLFRVAIPRVGVMDMMRYHLFTIGWNWASDYGTSADNPEMAIYLLGYSPLHTIKSDGTPYPAIMVTTADHDDRVVPAHSFKYAATLQAADTGDAPKLIRIDSNAGHGGGKPISKIIDEYTDLYSFIFYNIGVVPNENVK